MVRDARRCRAPHHEGPHPESLTENAASIFSALQQVERNRFFVMAGLVPAIYVFLAATLLRRGCPDKPGHDEFRHRYRFHWLHFESHSEEARSGVSKDETLQAFRRGAIREWRLRPPLSFCQRLALFFGRPMSVRNACSSLRTALAASRSIFR